MFLRNHGLVILGETIEEAFGRACATVQACEAQVRMMPVGLDNLILISDEAKRRSNVIFHFLFSLLSWSFFHWIGLNLQEVAKRFNEFAKSGQGVVRLEGEGEQPPVELEEKPKPARGAKWRQGDMEFEAYMRQLDNSVNF